MLPAIPFAVAERNFYRAAQHGHEARLLWPGTDGALHARSAPELALELLPVAARGLRQLGVASAEAARHLGVIRRRIGQGASGARWQLRQLDHLQPRLGRRRALEALVRAYRANSLHNLPVSEWPDIP